VSGWIGVDLDGTLVVHDHATFHFAKIGEPIPAMIRRVNIWLEEGRDVRLFTARFGLPPSERSQFLVAWANFSMTHFSRILPVTDRKDFEMLELWDDRAVQVEFNTGYPLELVP
jgi:hypothetical protein